MVRCRMIEREFLQHPLGERDGGKAELIDSLRASTVKLYTKAYCYQIRIIQHYTRGAARRFLKSFAGTMQWTESRAEIEKLDQQISGDLQVLGHHDIIENMEDFLLQALRADERNKSQHEAPQAAIKVI